MLADILKKKIWIQTILIIEFITAKNSYTDQPPFFDPLPVLVPKPRFEVDRSVTEYLRSLRDDDLWGRRSIRQLAVWSFMIVFPPSLLHKYFCFNNRFEHLSNSNGGSAEARVWWPQKGPFLNMVGPEYRPPFSNKRKILSRARESLPEGILSPIAAGNLVMSEAKPCSFLR